MTPRRTRVMEVRRLLLALGILGGGSFALWALYRSAAKTADVQQLLSYYGFLSPDEANALVDTAYAIGTDPLWLAAIIDLETDSTWSPGKSQSGSGTTGLIHMKQSQLAQLGYEHQAVERMSRVQQLRGPIKDYFLAVKQGKHKDGTPGPLNTFQALCMAVNFPYGRYRPVGEKYKDMPGVEPYIATSQVANTTPRDYMGWVRSRAAWKRGIPIDSPLWRPLT